MVSSRPQFGSRDPAMEVYFLGQLDFDSCLTLQQRLVYESSGRADGQITLLICEHAPIITIGRRGSRGHVHLSPAELKSRRLEVRWTNRGGGAMLHAPGQLAVYLVVPLQFHELSVGEYLRRLHTGLLAALADLKVTGELQAGKHGMWGRTGQLVAVGAAVKNWTTYFGAYINVCPAMGPFRVIQSDPDEAGCMSSLSLERQQPVRCSSVRASLVRSLAGAFECERHHLYTGHPLLLEHPSLRSEARARAV